MKARQLPLDKDDGKTFVNYVGYRVHHNGARGPYKGGIRYHQAASLDLFKVLAADVILVVVLGGIGLSGGKGGIRNVIVGTLLIGVLLNGMTIMDIQYTVQSVIKGALLLTAIIIDTLVNPRDEQTAQQGDI